MGLLDTVQRLHGGLDYHLARQNLLVSNLTQIDTPGYRPADLERTSSNSFQGALHTVLSTTDGQHLGGTTASASNEHWKVITDQTNTEGFDGNSVSLDREAVKVAANQMRYDTL